MTTKEKIEVMEAFERGEKIEWTQGGDKWFDCNETPDWAWDKRLYRIKPKPLPVPKFKAGDLLVCVDDDGLPNPYITEIVSVDKWYYAAKKPGSNNEPLNREILRVDKNHINADDVLWYWETLDTEGEWFHTNHRCDRQKALEYYSGDTELIPLYALGFRL